MRITLRQINNLLFVAIVIINLYVIAAPLIPQLTYWWDSRHTQQRTHLQQLIERPVETHAKAAVEQPNSLIIPAMMLNQPTLEGPESNWFNLLYKGIWRWPESSTPDKGGNTVFLAHRFSYTGPRGAFYYLNKLQIGDSIGVIWDGKTYTYSVVSSQTVPPTDTAIENNTPDSQITLFTCTPLWHPVDRLVVVAKLKGVS
ncbi:MAG TPA: class E sortase [Verrucomicrobiae bacterium]|nr:class E sortase [Verrucomicrobiae bacterium]